MPTIKKYNNRRAAKKRTFEGTVEIEMHQSQLLNTNQSQQSIMLYKVS